MLRTHKLSLPAAISNLTFLALAAAPLLCGGDAPPLPAPAFRASAELVLVPVTVTDRNGKTIMGLRARNFTVLDDRTPQPIVSFTSEDAPCSVGLVLDVSGSMRDAIVTARTVAHAFFQAANPEDEFLMLTVSTQPDVLPGFTTGTEALEQSIQSARPNGMTALFDTVYLALNRMRRATRPRHALLIVSDGMDNYSRYTKGELMRTALEANVQVYTVLVDGLTGGGPAQILFRPSMIAKPVDRAGQRQGPQALKELSMNTGGLYFHVRTSAQAKDAAIKAGHAIRNEYVIGYQPPATGTLGRWHSIRVKSNVPKTSVNGRSGYYSQ